MMNFFETFDKNQGNVIDSIKMLLYQRHDDIFERLDFENDNIFLEPLLFSYITQENNDWLDSIIYGYEKNPKQKIIVFTNKNGVIYIPEIGYFYTNQKSTQLLLEKSNNEFYLRDISDNEIPYRFDSIELLNENIELIKTQHPLFESFFVDNDNVVDVEIETCYENHILHFNNALNVIERFYPEYFNLIKKSVRKVMIYDGLPNSFAAIQAHNMIFLNAHDEDDEVFFLDHILHEGAHVIFNTLTYHSKIELFTVPFKTNLAEITKNDRDHGEIYGRFHGMFTQSNINTCMETCLNEKAFQGKQHKEILGRFSSNMKRFRSGIETFDIPNLYKEEVQLWYDFFTKKYNSLYERNELLVESFDVSNQPYVFSYEIFDKTNP